MKPFRKTNKYFQLIWNEPLGEAKCPYAYRFVLILFGYSIRLHYWLRSDDKRYMHDHPWNFRTFVLKGYYFDISKDEHGNEVCDVVSGTAYRKATHKHYVHIPKPGVITLLFCGQPFRSNKWGFWIPTRKNVLRPLKYFHKYGHPPCSEQ
jgi:hypothetical protein